MLALRPRRRGTPPRRAAVVQTQIVLAVVGAVIMLVVGASLARAFGIVGVAGLIRYRSKIRDPKDAVVMLATLAAGLASGAGLFALSIFSTVFLLVALLVIESFEPQTRTFELSVKLAAKTSELQSQIEGVLRRFKTKFELREMSESEARYVVTAPSSLQTDSAAAALMALEPEGKGAVVWKEIDKGKAAAWPTGTLGSGGGGAPVRFSGRVDLLHVGRLPVPPPARPPPRPLMMLAPRCGQRLRSRAALWARSSVPLPAL
jgi:hypothetical protein